MPFTLSHPAAVIPIRRYGVFSALVVGSMMPDALYFIPYIPKHQNYGHSFPGLFFFCLPAGIALLWLFHAFLKRPLISLFPAGQQGKLQAVSPDFHFWPFKRFLVIAVSVLIGAASHITWDAYTHTTSWGAQQFPILRQMVLVPGPFIFSVAEIMQMASSVVGMLLILFYYRRWLRTAADQPVRVHLPAFARLLLVSAFAAGAVAPAMARLLLHPEFWLRFKRMWVGYGAVDGIKVVCLEILLFCIAWHIFFGFRRDDASPMSHSSQA